MQDKPWELQSLTWTVAWEYSCNKYIDSFIPSSVNPYVCVMPTRHSSSDVGKAEKLKTQVQKRNLG